MPIDFAALLRQRGQYDPLAYPVSGPDRAALRLQQQGAPGAPARPGTCVVAIVCRLREDGRPTEWQARSKCGRGGSWHTGRDAQVIANRDADRLDGHICAR